MNLPELILGLAVMAPLPLYVGSGAIWVWGFLNLHSGKPALPKRFRSDLAPVPPFAAVLTLAYIAMCLWLLFQTRPPQTQFSMDQVMASISEGVIASMVLIMILISMTNRRTGMSRLGFRGDDRIGQVKDGFLGFVASLVPVFAVIVATLPFRSTETLHPFLRLLEEQGIGSEFVGIAIAAVIVAPIKEELMFRVILQSWLVRWVGVKPAIIGTAVIFAAVHGFPDALGLLPLALILGVVYQRRRSFISVVIIHALFNAFNLGLTLFASYAQQFLPTDAL